ncbi:hypothetical protein QFZ49_005692 [Streptomyces turgidiscabies]|uniref:Uncharacterized protein n=1 Tax=Streptomyces turgidiscabies TaxID=85558 RepID=A0ABU0RUT1_9ACTN|nr:hypothetical protein [Streptomyces turgidiscabies]
MAKPKAYPATQAAMNPLPSTATASVYAAAATAGT